jgi:hypothetical protein
MRHLLLWYASVLQLKHFISEPVGLFFLCWAAAHCANDSERCSVLFNVFETDWSKCSYPQPKIQFIARLMYDLKRRHHFAATREPDKLLEYLDHSLSDADKRAVNALEGIMYFDTITTSEVEQQ